MVSKSVGASQFNQGHWLQRGGEADPVLVPAAKLGYYRILFN